MKKWLIIALFFVACKENQSDDCFTSLGEVATQIVDIQNFTKLNVTDRISVQLIEDDTKMGTAEVVAPGNLIPQVVFEVENNWLSITNTNTCNFVRSYDYDILVKLYVDTLVEIETSSVATVFSKDTIHGSYLEIYHSALSDIDLLLDYSDYVYVRSLSSARTILSGKAHDLKGSIEEISDLDARNLVCKNVLVDNHSKWDCYINATEIIYVSIFNSGNIYYTQEPNDRKEFNIHRGSGQLVLLQ